MSRQERLSRLVDFVVDQGSAHIDQIVSHLGVSPATARRDLDALAEQQLVIRTRGGARSNPTTGDVPLRYRSAKQWRQKSAIAASACELVTPGQVVGFNGGTTTTAAAYELGVRAASNPVFLDEPITVVTNAVNIANDLTIRPQARVVVTGGVARLRSFELVGPLAALILPSIRIDLLFLGVHAVDLDAGGLYTQAEDEAAINAAMVTAAAKTVVLADSTKLGVTAFARICALGDCATLITDAGANDDDLDAVRAHGVEVIVA